MVERAHYNKFLVEENLDFIEGRAYKMLMNFIFANLEPRVNPQQ
jgi:hypothetical protein